MPDELAEAVDEARAKPPRQPIIPAEDLLSSGSTMLDLGCSGRIAGAFPKGTYNHFLGKSRGGKSLICHNTLAEANINPNFDDYRLIYDNPEYREFFDVQKLWGERLANRIEPPARDKSGSAKYSRTIEDFYFALDDLFDDGRPFVMIEDSMAVLGSMDEEEKFQENKTRHKKGKELAGSYGDGKAKKNSSGLRAIIPKLQETGSILIIVNQTRDNIGFGAQFTPEVFAGGRALTFYACLEMWIAPIAHLTTTYNGKKRETGITAQIKIKKNSINGRERTVQVPIYHSYGVDDLGSCVDFLIEEKRWSESQGTINASDFEFTGKFDRVIAFIEEEGLQRDLRLLCQEVWNEIEEACAIQRKPRYQ